MYSLELFYTVCAGFAYFYNRFISYIIFPYNMSDIIMNIIIIYRIRTSMIKITALFIIFIKTQVSKVIFPSVFYFYKVIFTAKNSDRAIIKYLYAVFCSCWHKCISKSSIAALIKYFFLTICKNNKPLIS